MGNRNSNTNNANSMAFAEDEEEEENWAGWMEGNSRIDRKFLPAYPGTQILPVQPIYRADSDAMLLQAATSSTTRTHESKLKSKRAKALRYYTKGRTTSNGLTRGDDFSDSEEENGDVFHENENNNMLQSNVSFHERREDEDICEEQLGPRGFPTGRVYVSLSYDAVTQRLKVTLLKAKNLSCKRTEGKDKCGINCSDSFVKFTLLKGEKEVKSHESAIKKGYSEVLYYENHAFDIEITGLQTLSLIITAVHCCKPHLIHHNHEIGRVVIPADLNNESVVESQLMEALTHPGQVIYEWHTIRS
ncbi:uncharacterized protein LOC5513261 isoform X1 [Nematostella vectensis]|uniref:uncharacterized protein LOC5513261 isoform X1 n=1 Tax=Nematostella vectensis TaxID=45351 RepID=UPI0020774727|nr:uncharacterized protein LOC5513261 isoform X1 [Nematostella vectensis]XP_032238646.2 uncharacterized protein LOC5513261 isoform X1 [Nematostella vectensis]XP_032238647.2 uncharacterized protein LOC5513261 isoform X1 [Nematostella vectensis]